MTASDVGPVLTALERALGPAGVTDKVSGHSIDGLQPRAVAFPMNVPELCDTLTLAADYGLAVAPYGGGTRSQLGNSITRLDLMVDLTRMNHVVQHTPADLTATFEAGISLSDVQETLGQHDQFLALDAPVPERATVGGTLAAGVSGPLKWQFGHPRDLVIGMKIVLADGTVTKSGGQVVKNVSGYDMARLHIGGLGTLGVIAEVSVKLTPRPKDETTVLATFGSSENSLSTGLDVFRSGLSPLALNSFDAGANGRGRITTAEASGFLAVRLGGRPRTLERQVTECIGFCRERQATNIDTLKGSDADNLWRRLSDLGWDEATEPALAARASLTPSGISEFVADVGRSDGSSTGTAVVSTPGYGNVSVLWYEDGDSEPIPTDAAVALLTEARDAAHRAGGHLVIERAPQEVKSSFDVWDEVGEPLSIMRRMKAQYDPKGTLNPGRYVGGL